MDGIKIKKLTELDDRTGTFINEEFSKYAQKHKVDLNYEDFCFVAQDDNDNILGVITGRAYYNEVHIGDLIIEENCRKQGLGSRLVHVVENEFSGKSYQKITLTTFGFQAPEFYKKLGYQLEFIRKDKDPNLCKFFFAKTIQ